MNDESYEYEDANMYGHEGYYYSPKIDHVSGLTIAKGLFVFFVELPVLAFFVMMFAGLACSVL
jgi:hypothetical protein